mgnify:CR=1 FL=1
MIISDRLLFAVEYLKNQLIIDAPFDTGNLALNAIRIQQINGDYHIVIGGEIAPYAVYTNESWKRGSNPNENWVTTSIEKSVPQIKNIMRGSISQDEYDKDIATQQKIIKQKLKLHLENKKKEKEKMG